MRPRRSMGWAALIMAMATAASAADFEVRVSEQAVHKVLAGVFPLRHRMTLAEIPGTNVSVGWTAVLSRPVVRIDAGGMVLHARLRVTGGGADAEGPARFVLDPRYDPVRRGIRFVVTESHADLSARDLRLGKLDLSWIASDLFVPLSMWIDGGNGPVRVEVVPSIALARGEIRLQGRVEVRRRRSTSATEGASR